MAGPEHHQQDIAPLERRAQAIESALKERGLKVDEQIDDIVRRTGVLGGYHRAAASLAAC